MDLAKIKALIDLVSRSRVAELELVEGDTTLRITRDAGVPPPQMQPDPAAFRAPVVSVPPAVPMSPAVPASAGDTVRSPSFGIFHSTPAPEAAPFVVVGSAVEAGQTLCLIEAMKAFTAVVVPAPGTVAEILVEAGQEVEAGQPLFVIRP